MYDILSIVVVLGGFAIGTVLVPLYRKLRQLPDVKDIQRINGKNPIYRDKLFKYAKSNLFLVSGEMHKYFSQTSFRNAVEDAVNNRKIKVQIICGPNVDQACSDFLNFAVKNKNISVYKSQRRPVDHFRIKDGEELFIEERHDPGTESKFIYYTNNKKIVNDYIKKFKVQKSKAELVNTSTAFKKIMF